MSNDARRPVRPTPGRPDQPEQPGHTTPYQEVQASPEFAEHRRRFRAFVFPVTAGFLAWYFLYVLCAAFAPGFMSHKLLGNINVGLVFGLLQFVSTFAITIAYVRWADRTFDPEADRLAARVEAGGAR